MSKRLTHAKLIKLLRETTEDAGSAKAWGELHKIGAPYISDVLNRRRDPGPKILKALGLRKVVLYEADVLEGGGKDTGFACPECDGKKTFVMNSRPGDGHKYWWRRRACSECKTRWTTYEGSTKLNIDSDLRTIIRIAEKIIRRNKDEEIFE